MELCRLEDRVNGGGDLRAAARSRAVVILSTDDGAADRALGGVVVERDARIVDESCESVPDAERVRGCLADGEMRVRRTLEQPRLQLVEDRWRLGATCFADAREISVAATINLVERTDPSERPLGVGMIGLASSKRR